MDKLYLHSQLEHLQSRYVGTGHPDISRHEWLTNQHRDSIASYIGHPNILRYMALSQNESISRVRYNLFQKMVVPCGASSASSKVTDRTVPTSTEK